MKIKKKILVDMSATLIHNGHIRLLKKASKLGKVIVALTTDKEIEKHKFYTPELNFKQRKEILDSIVYVSKVVPTNWVINDYLLKKLKIDFLVHGDDNSNEINPSKLITFKRTSGISSSLLRERSAQIYRLNKDKFYSWKNIWDNRIIKSKIKSSNFNLKNSMILNGHYEGPGKIPIISWKKYGSKLRKVLNINRKDTLFEVGCGSGAFLYLFKDLKKIGGCDYSNELIKYCKKFLKKHSKNIINKNSDQINDKLKYKFVFSHGLLHYLSDSLARKTIIQMIKKSKDKIAILDIPNKKFEKKYMALRIKSLGKKKYKKNYNKLPHNLYSKSFFNEIAKKTNCNHYFFQNIIENHKQGKYRFNVCFSKK
jgi:glycerol-3-phosphate cytidylyltransferase